MDHNWEPFGDSYKKAPDKATFYETGIQSLISTKDRLSLLTEAQLKSAAPFKWEHQTKGLPLSQALADFAQKNGSKKPTFDAMLWISQIVKICKEQGVLFNPDAPLNMSISIERGNLTVLKGSTLIVSSVPLLEETALAESNAAGKRSTRTESSSARSELSEMVEKEYLDIAINSIYIQAESGEFPQNLALLREFFIRNPNLDSLYLALENAHSGRPESLSSYVEHFINLLQDIQLSRESYPEQSNKDFENLNALIELLDEVDANYLRARVSEKEGRMSLFSPENDAFIEANRESIREAASDFYERLGLDPSKIGRDPEVFLEMAMRRERNILDWTDEAQEASAKYALYTDPKGSVGALGIQPETYLEALLLKHGLTDNGNYEANRLTAKTHGLIGAESDIVDQLSDPAIAIDIFTWILKEKVPPKNAPITIMLTRDGVKKPYKIPLQESYTFATGLDANKKPVGNITFSHDEMRLLTALARYQGSGLYLISKDKEVPLSGETITDTRQLVLNNRTTYCLAGLS